MWMKRSMIGVVLAGLLALMALTTGNATAQEAREVFTPPAGPPGTAVTVTNSPSPVLCPMIAFEQPVVWGRSREIGSVEGNSCTGWRGAFTVPQDAALGPHQIFTRAASGELEDLGVFTVGYTGEGYSQPMPIPY